jgi:hypothetical protein
MAGTRNNRGQGHLMLRSRWDFANRVTYEAFLREVMRPNRRNAAAFRLEHEQLIISLR